MDLSSCVISGYSLGRLLGVGGGGGGRTRTGSLPRLIIGRLGVSSAFRLSLFISEVQREDNSKICTDTRLILVLFQFDYFYRDFSSPPLLTVKI